MNTIIEENSINEIEKNYSVHNSLIISNDKTLKTKTNIKVFTINELCEYLIKKSPLLFTPYILSQSEGILLINSLVKELFKANPAFFNLTKSTSFSNNIYEIFKNFYNSRITPELFKNCIDKLVLSKEDFNRLNLIFKIYDSYTKKLKEQNLVDMGNLCNFTISLLEKNPRHLKIIKENCHNILIDAQITASLAETTLLNLIGTNIKIIDFIKKYQNSVSINFSNKYLKEEDKKEKIQKNCELKILEFNDINDEANFIAQTIAKKINEKTHSFSDFIIAVPDLNSSKVFNEILGQNNIPINNIQADETYDLFLIKLNQYLNICENKYKLSKTKNLSISCIEQIHEEINLNFENIISETFENQFIKDKILLSFENTSNQTLIDFIQQKTNILTVDNEKILKEEIKKIEELFELYSQNNICKFISYASKNIKLSILANKNIAQIIKKINSTEKLILEKNYFIKNPQILKEIINSSVNKPSEELNDYVKIATIQKAQNQFSKILFLPNLTEKNIPTKTNQLQFISQEANDLLTNEIKKYDKNYKNFILDTNEQIINSAKDFINIISQGQEEIIFSTHKYENKKQIIPSIFFEYLKTLLPIKIIEEKPSTKEEELQSELFIKDDISEVIIKDEDVLKLSPSSISNFQTCPKKFYFSNLLGLKSLSTFSATYGTIVHSIFEVFNKKYLNSYNKETLLFLSDILFNSNKEPQKALNVGFNQKNISLISATDLLSLEEMKFQFEDALCELEKTSFFKEIPDEVICEKSFKFIHPSIPNVIFDGRIDAIYKFGNNYKIIDFKTGANKEELSYLISENGVNFKTKTGKETDVEIKQNKYEYQIPLYYFACKYSEDLKEIKDNIKVIGLSYIRPKSKDNGVKEDVIVGETIEAYEEKIIQNLKETIINKIRNKTYYEARPNSIICKNCAFNNLCEFNSEEEND